MEGLKRRRGNDRHPKLSKPIIDEIDELLAKHYGFTEEELDFIINYDIKYRMGNELNAGSEDWRDRRNVRDVRNVVRDG
ncbi:MAG: hypothetical protein IJK04_03590 [Kiritimatiellae bacterium]|nr:hypothetical protein [Kiritimatiellia bacterium]